jgi:hypothetical protein
MKLLLLDFLFTDFLAFIVDEIPIIGDGDE